MKSLFAKKILIVIMLVIPFLITSCDRKKDATETNKYNAFIVYKLLYPKNKEKKVYVGTVTGLSSCKYIVSEHYSKRRKHVKNGWDYLCCLKTEDSECAEEHRYGED